MISPNESPLRVPLAVSPILDAIIGKMVRELLDFEGRVATREVRLALSAVVESARHEALYHGLPVDVVDKVASKMNIYVHGKDQ